MKTIPLTNAEKTLLNKVVKYTYNDDENINTLEDLLNDLLMCADMSWINNKAFWLKPLTMENIYHPLDKKYYDILMENGINPFEYIFGDYVIGKIINDK